MLGYPAWHSGRPHPVQRWRCEIAARSRDPHRASRLVFTGAGRDGEASEAAVMSGYARDVLGVPAGQIALEDRARTTRQNIKFSLPLVQDADVIKIASDPLHAARARRYLRQMRPDLAARVRPADDYRFADHWALKVGTIGYELVRAAWWLIQKTIRLTGVRGQA